jgi:arylsulfatase A-like enzyme
MPEVYDVPVFIHFPGGEHAGERSDIIVQHHDLTAVMLDQAEVEPPEPIEGVDFLDAALGDAEAPRDHATVGWGSAVTVITDKWWLNAKMDGTGVLLYDLKADDPYAQNVADAHPEVVRELFKQAEKDAEGGFPDWLVELASNQADAPGCSELAARE